VLEIGDTLVPEHRLRIATGYDDLYHLTPARVLRNCLQLGYRGPINHYVGMSHYFRLEANSGGFYISLAGGVLNAPCAAWHADFCERAKALGYELILSLSYELLDQHVWGDWKQRAQDGSPALTGWSPPSTLLSPAHDGAMYYLRVAAQAFAGDCGGGGAAGAVPGRRALVVGDAGRPHLPLRRRRRCGFAPVPIADVRAPLTRCGAAGDARRGRGGAGGLDGGAVAAVRAWRRTPRPCCSPICRRCWTGPDLKRANVPLGWASPAFDLLQLEDYDWVTGGNAGASDARRRRGRNPARLSADRSSIISPASCSPPSDGRNGTHRRGGRGGPGARVAPGVRLGAAAGAARRLHLVRFRPVQKRWGRGRIRGYVRFPVALGREASVEPAFSTAMATGSGGAEQKEQRLGGRAAALRRRAGGARRGGSARPDRLLPGAARRGDRLPVRGSVRQQLERHDRGCRAGDQRSGRATACGPSSRW
jgi:hypothetical protein